jgi:hypothetical protein
MIVQVLWTAAVVVVAVWSSWLVERLFDFLMNQGLSVVR